MALIRLLQTRRWTAVFGYLLFIGMMATGYYYNVTFVQLGLVDLGTRVLGMSEQAVATNMAVLAVLTCATALAVGVGMGRSGRSRDFRLKLRLAVAVVAVQTVLTAVAPHIRSEGGFLAWIVVTSLALGVGVPATFGLTVDLIPVRDRGYAAAFITAGAYFAAAVFSGDWRIETFSSQLLWLMVAGTVGLGVIAFGPFPFLDTLAQQHTRPGFGRGRFVEDDPAGGHRISRRLIGLILLMFGIFFVDSLGFLRIIDTPLYVESAWQSSAVTTRLFIGGVHVATALIAGVLYASLRRRSLFYWIFGIFALVHFMYAFHARVTPFNVLGLATPMLYATAVSLYTVVNFALWADVSTPDTITRNAALGVAGAGWAATFISTALAIRWQTGGMPVEEHLRIVDALAILFFVGMLLLLVLPGRGPARQSHRPQEDPQ